MSRQLCVTADRSEYGRGRIFRSSLVRGPGPAPPAGRAGGLSAVVDAGAAPAAFRWSRDLVRRRLAARREAAVIRSSRASSAWQHGDQVAGGATARRPDPTPAAVLVALVDRDQGPTVLLTQRTAHLRDHAGQICFPGGRMEQGDGGDPAAAALREAEEEIGLPRSRVEILGQVAPYETVTGFRVHPVVGWTEPPLDIVPDPFEVADVFEVPLAFVLDPANHERHDYEGGGVRRRYYVLPYERRRIWGATAGMLVNLSLVLGDA